MNVAVVTLKMWSIFQLNGKWDAAVLRCTRSNTCFHTHR